MVSGKLNAVEVFMRKKMLVRWRWTHTGNGENWSTECRYPMYCIEPFSYLLYGRG